MAGVQGELVACFPKVCPLGRVQYQTEWILYSGNIYRAR